MQDRIGEAGGTPQKPPKYAPIFVAASLTGIWTQRHIFHDPSNIVTQRFYGGRPDVLSAGINAELSNDLTLTRRPGLRAATLAYAEVPTCAFSFELDDGSIQVLIDTPSAVYIDPLIAVSATLLFNKSAAAGQGYFVGSGSTLYYGDGVDLIKYTPGNPNGLIWKWGIAAPGTAPTVGTTASGASAVAWVASTVFSTMGLIVDPNGNAEQLFSVNADPSSPNNTQIGTSGDGAPSFNLAYNATTTDGGVTWTSLGQISLWSANTVFQPGQCIYDPGTNCLFISSHSTAQTTGTNRPNFTATLGLSGARISESSGARWENIGQCKGGPGGTQPTAVLLWAKNTPFNQFQLPATGSDPTHLNSAICFPIAPFISANGQLCNGQPVYLLGASTAGTTANTNYTPWAGISANNVGDITTDNQLAWCCQGSATWAATTLATAWQYGQATFSVIFDGTNMQVCIVSGITGGTVPAIWGTVYGSQTNDGGATWVCVGPPVTWAASTQWYLPLPGFAPPSTGQQYGGAQVVGSAFVQAVTSSGLSGSSAPTWATTVGVTTTDNGITWTVAAAYTARGVSFTKSHVWAYSFKCREADDDYVTTSLLTFAGLNTQSELAVLGNVPGLTSPLGTYLGGGTGAVSTASPVATIDTPGSGVVVNISAVGSTDPQVDTIIIWQDADGGGPDNMFELIEIPAPKPIGGVAQPWSFDSFLPDLPTTTSGINYPGLDNLSGAPINDQNNPPPPGFLPLCDELHFSRIWGAVGNTVLSSGGPDVLVGNPNEAFNPDDDFPFKSTVVACIHTPAGLLCPTTRDIECIYGGPSTSSFYSTALFPGVGLLSYNAWDIHGGEIYFVSSDSQAYVLSPSLNLSRIGFPIGDKTTTVSGKFYYVTVHEQGTDNGIYFAGGGVWWRLNPHQVGADVSGENVSVWSPLAATAFGVGMMQSVCFQPGNNFLLVGANFGGQPILKRDPTIFTDNGTAYPCEIEIGAITMVFPGQRAAVKFVEFDFEQVGTQPLVYYALDDPRPSPAWVPLVGFVFDPPVVYAGTAITPPYWPDRYDLSQNADVSVGRRIRLKVDFGSTDTVKNEMISFAIFGRKYVEG